MSNLIHQVREPVKRGGAERYLLITLLSFAASVVITRLFLQLTGYPQVGGGRLHIAHVLWGGLLLFIASLLPLILANRWVYTLGAVLSGVGVGLFIDEVGKFITRTNDYFYPAAAPLIYAFFLLTVLVYLQVRRPPSHGPRAELYRALDVLAEVLDYDLEPHERVELEARLRHVIQEATDPEYVRLAKALLQFLESDVLQTLPAAPSFWDRILERARSLEFRYLGRRRLKTLLILGLGLLGVPSVLVPISLVMAGLAPGNPSDNLLEVLRAAGRAAEPGGLTWILAWELLSGVAALPLLAAALFLLAGRDHRGVALAHFGLIFSLAVVNLLVFYFDQFQAIGEAGLQFLLLLGGIHYRRHYLPPRATTQKLLRS